MTMGQTILHNILSSLRRGWCILFLGLILIPAPAQEQVPVRVQKSTNKVVIGGKTYYIHVVKPGETLYSISKAYNVSQVDISRENPMIMMGLQADMALKIPIQPTEPGQVYQDSLSSYIYHRMETGQTVYFLSREYQVTVDEILEANPGLKIDDIAVGQVIKIPKMSIRPPVEGFTEQDPRFIYHRVERRETLFSLARQYHVSAREIRQANDGLPGGLKTGQIIRIPRTEPFELARTDTTSTDTASYVVPGPGEMTLVPEDLLMFDHECDSSDLYRRRGGMVNLALFLPLYLDENDVRSYVDSSELNQYGKKIYKTIERDQTWIYARSFSYIEFYEGAMLAIDHFVSQGMRINLKVYDTARDSLRVQQILDNQELEDMNLIIGPVFTSFPSNFQLVARYAREHHIPVVSPLSPNSSVLQGNPYAFQVQPDLEAELDILAACMAAEPEANLVLVHEGDSLRKGIIEYFKRDLFNRLSYQSFSDQVLFKEVIYDREHPALDTINTIEHALSRQMNNLVLVLSDDEPFVSKAISNLYNLTGKYQVQVLGMSSWQRFENIDLEYLFGLQLRILTSHYVDYRDPAVLDFLEQYRQKYETEPSPFSYAWDGHDILYFFLSACMKYGPDCYYCLPRYHEKLLHTEYGFTRSSLDEGFENVRFWMLKYLPGLTIEKAPVDLPGNRLIPPRLDPLR